MILKEEFLKECEKNLSTPLAYSKKYGKFVKLSVVMGIVSLILFLCLCAVALYISANFEGITLILLQFTNFLFFSSLVSFCNFYLDKLQKSAEKISEIALSYLGFSLGDKKLFDCPLVQSSKILKHKGAPIRVFENKGVGIASYVYIGEYDEYATAFSIPYQSKAEALIKNELTTFVYNLKKVEPLFLSSFFENNSVFMTNPDEAEQLLTHDFVKKMEQALSVLNNLKTASKQDIEILVCSNQIIFCFSTRYDVLELDASTAYLERCFSFFHKKKSLDMSKKFDNVYNIIDAIEKIKKIFNW